MADEIEVLSAITVRNGNSVHVQPAEVKTFDQTNPGGGNPGLVVVGTSEEQIDFGELTSPGWFTMINLDTTNYVEWGFSTGVYGGRMEPGEPAGPFRLNPAASVYVKANTASCRILAQAWDD
jgi:hypothetical protein